MKANVLYDKSLFDITLIEPSTNNNELLIVSGYATAAMVFHHLNKLAELQRDVKIRLIIGMAKVDGISEADHKGFCKLMQNPNFECSYLNNLPATHSKVYVWCKNDLPAIAFTGSANYTQRAFSSRQREVLTECDPYSARDYFYNLTSDTIYANHQDAQSEIPIFNGSKPRTPHIPASEISNDSIVEIDESIDKYEGLEFIEIDLFDRHAQVPEKSGLNWGQRANREPNQAYLSVRGDIRHSDFFPKNGIHFTVLTDDDIILICTRAQQDGKAIETPHDNSQIGKYFRNRLNIPLGLKVTKEHIQEYGRNIVRFYKIDDETFYMDYSRNT